MNDETCEQILAITSERNVTKPFIKRSTQTITSMDPMDCEINNEKKRKLGLFQEHHPKNSTANNESNKKLAQCKSQCK